MTTLGRTRSSVAARTTRKRSISTMYLVGIVALVCAVARGENFNMTDESNSTTSAELTIETTTTSARDTFDLEETTATSTASSVDGMCVARNAACLSDAGCTVCLEETSQEDDAGVPCHTRYPILLEESVSTCQIAGAIYCCYYGDHDTASTCLENNATANYWECVLTNLDYGCGLADMPCSPEGVAYPTGNPSPAPSIEGTSAPSQALWGSPGYSTGSPTQSPTSFISTLTASSAPSTAPDTSSGSGEPGIVGVTEAPSGENSTSSSPTASDASAASESTLRSAMKHLSLIVTSVAALALCFLG